jgi:hypothetical protein
MDIDGRIAQANGRLKAAILKRSRPESRNRTRLDDTVARSARVLRPVGKVGLDVYGGS